jgi:hypothetical protein
MRMLGQLLSSAQRSERNIASVPSSVTTSAQSWHCQQQQQHQQVPTATVGKLQAYMHPPT